MKKLFNIAVVAIFCAVIFTVPVLTKLEDYSGYSFAENRNLAAAPVLTADELLSGRYTQNWETYFADHIWKRDSFLTYYTKLNAFVLKKPVINDVVMGDNVLLPFNPFYAGDYDYHEQAQSMAADLSRLDALVAGYGGQFVYIGVPEQMSMLRELYPDYLNNDDARLTQIETEFFAALDDNGIAYINMRDEFLRAEDYAQFYSQTDHHYKLFGAFYTYRALINSLNDGYSANLPSVAEADIEFARLDNPFFGSRNRKLYKVYNSGEALYYYTAQNPVPFERQDNGEAVENRVFTLPVDSAEPVTYGLYMDGDIGETIIRTNREELPNALIFGDSFTNPFETFLYNSFNETVSIDLRHYDELTILEYIDAYKPDYVFCMRDDTAYLSTDGNGRID